MSDTETLKKKTIPLLRAVLTAKAKVGIPLHMLCSEFEETCMEPLKFREMGYGSLEQFLRDCSEICGVTRAPEGYLVVKGVASKEDAHIFKLVSGQKKKSKKKSKRIVSLNVRRASNFSRGGRRANPTITRYNNNFMPAPQRSLLGNPPAYKQSFPSNVLFSSPKLRQTPTSSGIPAASYKVSNLPPRFQRLKQNNAFIKVQNQVNKTLQMALIQNNNPPYKKSPLITETIKSSNGNAKSKLSPQELAALERKLRKLLVTKSNGMWASRLRPEFKTMFGEVLPDDIPAIIRDNFLSFIKIESPMPNMEILHLKEDKEAIVKVSEDQLQNGTPPVTRPAPTVAPPVASPVEVPSLNLSSSKPVKQKSTSTRTSEFKIELPDLPNVGDEIKVFVCHVESLDRFFVQFANSPIQDLVDEMQLFYEEGNCSTDIGKPRLNEYCCARYSKDKLWFRSKILSVKEQKNILNESYRCRVIYVDYGNDEYVISTELKSLTEEFCRLPSQAIQCCLYKLFPMEGSSWSEEVITLFKHVTDGVELTMVVKEENGPVLSVDLVDVNGQSVCAYFFTEKIGKRSNSILTVADFTKPTPVASPGSTSPRTPPPSIDKVILDSETVALPQSSREIKPRYVTAPAEQDYIDLSVSHINSTNNLAIVLIGPEYDEQLDKLEEKMADYYENLSYVASVEVNNYYAVLYEGDWVRVKLLSLHDTEYEVLLLDHGNKTIVSKEEIKDLPMQFLDPPFQAIPCTLANVPECFDAEILQYLTETTLRKAMIGYIVERSSEETTKMAIELYDTTNEADDVNINNEINEKIENEKDLCPRLPQVGEGHCNAYIAHISQTGEVFLQILGPGTARLEILMKDMTTHFTQTRASEIIQRPQVGVICCAKFFEDGSWYRAKITKVMQKERKVEVEFIDYGNYEVIQMLFIRNPDAVNKKVVSLPAQAVKCRISGFSETNLSEETYKRMREFIQSLDVVYVNVVGFCDDIPVVKISIPSEDVDGATGDFLECFELEQSADVNKSSDISSNHLSETDTSSGVNSTCKDATTFKTIPNIDNTSFEDISVAGEESYCKINQVRSSDSSTILSEYDVITNVPMSKDFEKTLRGKTFRSESPAFCFSSKWGIPQMILTESVIEGVIQDSHDPSKFSFIPYRLWEELETLHIDMMEAYKFSTCDNVSYNIGDVCALYHHKHEIWYRAVIMSEIEDEVIVKYPDFSGTLEVESSQNVRPLLTQFRQLPFLAVRCALAGVEPLNGAKNWDPQIAGLFNEMVMNETFQVEITSKDFNKNFSNPLKVLLHGATDDGKRFIINEKLIKMGFARKSR